MAGRTNTIVIVESPAKASTIEKYLGDGYTVLASYGHVRDLLNKNGSVDPDRDFHMLWAQTDRSEKHVAAILRAVKGSSRLLLATDPDREGEAIAWHISEIISEKYKGKTPLMQRVVFHEITKNAVLNAIQNPHEVDRLLVNAYLARRALDYLVGYSLSPILWQKLPGARSAGRVQSVALRLIVEREQDIEKFESKEYWTINGKFETPKCEEFVARLFVYAGEKLAKLSINNGEQAAHICSVVAPLKYSVVSVEKKQVHRNAVPPFTTSTLQQEASRKLGFGASRTMRTAQKLYEGVHIDGEQTGLITYMRTDSVNLSKEAVSDMRKFIKDVYGKKYLPKEPRVYKTKAKNAQEAHEAIRPTDIFRRPDDVAAFLDGDQRVLYNLIWKRAVASQMESAVFDQVTAEVAEPTGQHKFKAVGTTQVFDGFLRVYQEGLDENTDKDSSDKEGGILPDLQEGMPLVLTDTLRDQHFTQPPPRYTEATLVKHLEELGIGRPSTYAPLIQVLQDREYAVIEKRHFVPSSRGRIVTAFLSNFCNKYVEYDFTARLEDELDDIANGELEWTNVMRNFWADFSSTVAQMKEIHITDVISKLEENLATYLFKDDNAKNCQQCDGKLGLKLSKFGAFLGCSNYPECKTRISVLGGQDAVAVPNSPDIVEIGVNPSDGAMLLLKSGPYGFYIEADKGEAQGATTKKKLKPKRVGVPATIDPKNMTLELAVKLIQLPKTIGEYQGNDMQVNNGKFGPYIKCGDILASIPKSLNFLDISADDAVRLIKAKMEKVSKNGSANRARAGIGKRTNKPKSA
ncbi:MAG: type I DNA topoisomerase [Holosporales bacterium]|nr:type I DNA topoisomerase [Holosporales bacterium]